MSQSILFMDSFDHYITPAQKWDTVGNPTLISISPTAARNGLNGLLTTQGTVRKNFASRATYIVGFAYQVPISFSGANTVCDFQDSGTIQVSLGINSSGQLGLYRGSPGGTLLGSLTSPISLAAWHYIEVEVTIDPSAGVAKCWLDGVLVINLTSQNTRVTTNSSANQFLLGPDTAAGNTKYYDDLYVMDPTAGGLWSAPLGDTKCQCQLPSANGTLNNYSQNAASWAASTVMAVGNQIIDSNGNLQRVSAITSDDKTGGSRPTWATTPIGALTTDNHVTWQLIQVATLSNFNFVNENPPDDNGSYLSDATVNDQDRYTYPAFSGAAVYAMAVNLRAEKDDVGTRSIRAVVKSGSTTADNGTDFPLLQNSYQDFQAVFETDPNTSAQWTLTNLNAAESGIKTTA